MATAIYMRVSTERQEMEGVSLENQKERLNAYCTMKGFKDVKEYLDVGSARTTEKRINFNRMMEDVESGFISNVVILKLDRLTRSLIDLNSLVLKLNENDCQLHSCIENIDTTTASGRMMINLIGTFAQWESETISERVSTNMQTLAEKGVWMSAAPFGFELSKDKKLTPKEEEAKLLQEAYSLVLRGESFTSAEHKMNIKYNLDWYSNYLARKLKQPSLVGDIIRNGKLIENTHEGIISKSDRNKLMEILQGNKTGRRALEHNDLFRRKVICPQCDKIMSMNARSHDNYKNTYYSYICNDCHKNKRPFVSVSEKNMEKAFENYVSRIKVDGLQKVEIDDEQEDNKNKLKAKIKQLVRKKDKIQRAWINELISDDDLQKYKEEIDQELIDTEDELASFKVNNVGMSVEDIKEIVTHVSEHYKKLTRIEKKEFIQENIQSIKFKRELMEGYKKRYRFTVEEIIFF